jgi:uncharacterized cupin superfamily protein
MASTKSYTRIVSTADGGSAFEDAELQLGEQQLSDGTPPMFAGGLAAATGVAFVRFSAFDSAPHAASEPQWVVMLRGVVEVTAGDGSTRRFGPGDLVLAADTTGRGHVTTTVGGGPFEALVVPTAPGD